MDHRRFNSIVGERLNEAWAGKVLKMVVNKEKNIPDLKDDKKLIEVKFRVIYPNQYCHRSWTVLEDQMKYGENADKPIFWGLGFYHMSAKTEKIISPDIRLIARKIYNREIFIVPWNWIDQWPSYLSQGKTEKSEWNRHIRYPKAAKLPEAVKSFRVRGGLVHITEDVPENLFGNIDGNSISFSSLPAWSYSILRQTKSKARVLTTTE